MDFIFNWIYEFVTRAWLSVPVYGRPPRVAVRGGAPSEIGESQWNWGVIEVLGHRRHQGRFRSAINCGTPMIEVEDLCRDGSFSSYYYLPHALFSVRLLTEATVRTLVVPKSSMCCTSFASGGALPTACVECGHDAETHRDEIARRDANNKTAEVHAAVLRALQLDDDDELDMRVKWSGDWPNATITDVELDGHGIKARYWRRLVSAGLPVAPWVEVVAFRGQRLRDADLVDADLRGADLSGADLRGADLSGADLRGASLEQANLTGAYMVGADLTDGCFAMAKFTCANLTGARLCGADLTGADLTGANFIGANFMGAKWPAPQPIPAGWNVIDGIVKRCADA